MSLNSIVKQDLKKLTKISFVSYIIRRCLGTRSNAISLVSRKNRSSAERVAEIVKALNQIDPNAAELFVQLYLGDLVSRDDEAQ